MSDYNDQPRFKAAAVQAGSVFRDAPQWIDLAATLEKAIGLIEEAGRNSARLVVFPECWLPCYPYWSLDLTQRPAFTEMWAKLLWSSVEVPSQETEALCAAAKRANTYVVMGINERDRKYHGRMYNSILYLSPQGEIIGTHRKICTTVQERLFHTPGDGGDNLKAVFKTEIGYIGGSICGEHRQLPMLYNWIMQGIQIHCSLWPGRTGMESLTDFETRAASYNADAFGVLAATYVPEADRPKNFYHNSLFSMPSSFRGGSGIISPFGEYIAGPVYDQETIVYGDIDLAECDRSHYAANLAGLYSRWDLFSINVRQENYEPIVPMKSGAGPIPAHEPNLVANLEKRVKELEEQISQLRRQSQARRKGKP